MSSNHHVSDDYDSGQVYDDRHRRGTSSWQQRRQQQMLEDRRQHFQGHGGGGESRYHTSDRDFHQGYGGDDEEDMGNRGAFGDDDGSYHSGEDGPEYHFQDGQFQAEDEGQQPFDEGMNDVQEENDFDQPSQGNDGDETPVRSNNRPVRDSTGHGYQGEEQYGEDEGFVDQPAADAMDEHESANQQDEELAVAEPMIQKDPIVQEVKVMVDEKLQNMRFHTNKLLEELEMYVETLGNTEQTYLAVQQEVHAEADHLDRCEENVERAINGLGLSVQGQQQMLGNMAGGAGTEQLGLSQAAMAGAMNLSALGRRNSHDSHGSHKSNGRISRQGSYEDHS